MNTQRLLGVSTLQSCHACCSLEPAFRLRVPRGNVIDEPISRATHERDGEEQDVVPAQEDLMSFDTINCLRRIKCH